MAFVRQNPSRQIENQIHFSVVLGHERCGAVTAALSESYRNPIAGRAQSVSLRSHSLSHRGLLTLGKHFSSSIMKLNTRKLALVAAMAMNSHFFGDK